MSLRSSGADFGCVKLIQWKYLSFFICILVDLKIQIKFGIIRFVILRFMLK